MSPIKYKQPLLPRMIRLSVILAVLLAALWYVAFQARFMIEGPMVTLTPEPQTVSKDRVVVLTGKTENITSLTVNGRPIATDPEGNFNESVILENGYTIMSIDARDRYGRSVHIERPLVYQPDTEAKSELSYQN